MQLDFAHWDLVSDDGTTQSVLRALVDGVPVSDSGSTDSFVSPLVAAEAAWRVKGERPGSGSWLDLAFDAFDGEASGVLDGRVDPPVRLITSSLMEESAVDWIRLKLSLAPTGEWAMASDAGIPSATTSGSMRNLSPVDPDRALSGTRTDEWAMASAAGIPQAQLSDSSPALTPVDGGRELSGDQTAEWVLVRHAVEAAGAPKVPVPEPIPAGPVADKPLSGTSTHAWSFAERAGVDPADE